MRTLTLQWCWGLTTVFAALLFAYAARAGEPDFVPSPDLLAAAKKEGKIVLYTANFFDTEQVVATRFGERFPAIKKKSCATERAADHTHQDRGGGQPDNRRRHRDFRPAEGEDHDEPRAVAPPNAVDDPEEHARPIAYGRGPATLGP